MLGRRAVVDPVTALIAVAGFIGLTRFKRIPEPLWIMLAGLLGVLFRGLGSPLHVLR